MPRQVPPAEISKKFSAGLRRLRGKRSQAAFAQLLGITHQQTYARYEKGTVPPSDVLVRMAARLGVEPQEILHGTAQPKSQDAAGPAPEPGDPLEAMTTHQLEQSLVRYADMVRREETFMRPTCLHAIRQITSELLRRLPHDHPSPG
jgi:transcriptional regulator with XRE-family HTH domain